MKRITLRSPNKDRVQVDIPESYSDITGTPPSTLSVSAFGSAPNANGATVTAGVLNLEPASSSQPGGVSTGTQSFKGNKSVIGTLDSQPVATAKMFFKTGYLDQNPTLSVDNPSGKVGGLLTGTSGTGYIFDSSGYFWVIADAAATIRGGTAGNSGTVVLQISAAGVVTALKQVIAPAFELAYDGVTVPLSSGFGIALSGAINFYQSGTLIGTWIGSSRIAPNIDNNTDLGSSSKQFKDLYLGGKATFQAPNVYSGANGLTAHAGGGQGSAVPITTEVAVVATVASAGDSVKLPTAVLGMKIVVFNDGANAMDVFPTTGGSIDALGANTAISIVAGSFLEFIGKSGTAWGSRL